jgi:hypothetical protein
MSRSISSINNIPAEVRTFLESDKFPSNDFIGLEIELEGFPRINKVGFDSAFWRVIEDGSLRDNGREFLFSMPLCGADILSALDYFDHWVKQYTKIDAAPSVSDRTSIHVHLDIRDFDLRQLNSLNLLYVAFEKMLFQYCGKDRELSNYCIPLYRDYQSPMRFSKIKKSVTDKRVEVNSVLAHEKYSAYNTHSVLNLGTVEFRQHPGTFNIERMAEWIGIILSLKKAARDFDISIDTFPTYVSEMGPYDFVRSIFGDSLDKLIYPNFQVDIISGIRRAQEIIQFENVCKNSDRLKRSEGFKQVGKENALIKWAEVNKKELSMEDIETFYKEHN